MLVLEFKTLELQCLCVQERERVRERACALVYLCPIFPAVSVSVPGPLGAKEAVLLTSGLLSPCGLKTFKAPGLCLKHTNTCITLRHAQTSVL